MNRLARSWFRWASTLLGLLVLQAPQPVVGQERPGWIGVSVNVLTTGDDTGIRTTVVVTDVQTGSPAAAAGIRPGDTLMEVNDMRDPDALREMASRLRLSIGDPVRVVLRRGEQRQEVRLVAAARPQILTPPRPTAPLGPDADSMVMSIMQAMDSMRVRLAEQRDAAQRARPQVQRTPEPPAAHAPPPSASYGHAPVLIDASGAYSPLAPYVLGRNRVAGAEVIDVGPDLARYFGVEGGVLLIDVPAGTPAAAARLRGGDVIVQLGDAPVRSVDELRYVVSRSRGDLTVLLIRHGERMSVVLPSR
jgi:membrane-associated protease RseP (regulator of RpoE activity)